MHASYSSNETLSTEAKLTQLSSELQQTNIQKQLKYFFDSTRKMLKEQAKLHLPKKTLSANERREIIQPQVFISYAWEPGGSNRLKNLHIFLEQFKKDLQCAGLDVWLDLSHMTGNMSEKMRKGIKESKYILIIGTQCYAQRTADTDSKTKTNARKELDFALSEAGKSDNFMLPLLFEKDFDSVFPGIKDFLIRDCRKWIDFEKNSQPSWHDYISGLTTLSSPMGILPCLLGLTLKDYPTYRQACLREYTKLQRLLELELKEITTDLEKKGYPLKKNSSFTSTQENKYDVPINDKIEIVINSPAILPPVIENISLQEIKIIPNMPFLSKQAQAEMYCRKGQEFEKQRDYKSAYQQYQLAAELKYPSALTCLGYFALKGLGTSINNQLAYTLFLEAANMGHPRAMNNLAKMLVYGIGVEKNCNQAIFWYQKNGSLESLEKAKKLIEKSGDKIFNFG